MEDGNINFNLVWKKFFNEIYIKSPNSQQMSALEKSMDYNDNLLCIQGAAGTGKTEVLSLIALLMAF